MNLIPFAWVVTRNVKVFKKSVMLPLKNFKGVVAIPSKKNMENAPPKDAAVPLSVDRVEFKNRYKSLLRVLHGILVFFSFLIYIIAGNWGNMITTVIINLTVLVIFTMFVYFLYLHKAWRAQIALSNWTDRNEPADQGVKVFLYELQNNPSLLLPKAIKPEPPEATIKRSSDKSGYIKTSVTMVTKFLLAFCAIMILSIPITANADTTNPLEEQQNVMASKVKTAFFMAPKYDDASNDKEYAHLYLSQFFGRFVFYPFASTRVHNDDNDSTTLARMIGFSNILALILGLFLVYYLLVGGAINTASQGEILGKSWSSPWVPIRVMLGFFLITPIPTALSLMSTAQAFLLWAIIVGSNTATVFYNEMVDSFFLESDGITQNNPNINMPRNTSKDIYLSTLCAAQDSFTEPNKGILNMVSSFFTGDNETKQRDTARNAYFLKYVKYEQDSASTSYASYTRVESEVGYKTAVEMAKAVASYYSGSSSTPTRLIGVEYGTDGKCGYLDATDYDSDNTTAEDNASDFMGIAPPQLKAAQNDAVKTMVLAAVNHSAAYYELLDSSFPLTDAEGADKMRPRAVLDVLTTESIVDLEDNAETMAKYTKFASSLYQMAPSWTNATNASIQNAVMNKLKQGEATKVSSDGTAEITASSYSDTLKNGGWMRSGLYYYETASLQTTLFAAFEDAGSRFDNFYIIPKATCTDMVNRNISERSQQANSSNADEDAVEECVARVAELEAMVEVSKIAWKSVPTTTSSYKEGDVEANLSADSTMATFLGSGILNILSGSSGVGVKQSVMQSPFTTVARIGNRITGTINAGLVTYGLLEVAAAVSRSSLLGSSTEAFSSPLELVAKSILIMVMVLAPCAYILTYLIPILPVITWLLMLIGFMITTAASVFSVPLAVIMLVIPEGEGLAGMRLERALQLIMVAILKPTLMVMGLLVSISVSFVAFNILNHFLFAALEKNLLGSVADIFAVIIIYCTASLQVCKLLIATMDNFQDIILDWLSSGVGSSFGEKSATQGLDEAGNSAKGSISSGMGYAMQMKGKGGGEQQKPNPDKKEK